MRKTLLIFPIILILIFSILKPAPAHAEFANAYIRLNTQTPNSVLSGTVCAQPSSAGAGVETSVAVTFPDNFTVSTDVNNWKTNVTNLPSGATAWNGVSTNAANVSGQTVTFTRNDLTLDTLYCFNFNSASSTTGAASNNLTGAITTKNASNITIDSTTYALSIISNNQISVTASIDPQASDLPVTIEALTTGAQFPQNTTLSYKITYGLNTISSMPLTIQAQWSQGTINGSPTPSVDILDYVIGSATDAYSSTPAVINNVNRTITWTISSIPGGTVGQTVTFSLKTNNSYTGANNVSFDISARAMSGSTTTPDTSVTQNYLYNASLEPTPTPTPAASTTPSTTSGAGSGASDNLGCGSHDCNTQNVQNAQPNSAIFIFNSISITSISKSDAQISILTNKNATATISYGTSLTALDKKVQTVSPQTTNLVTLSDLTPDTDYYFKITATDINENTIKSDIYTFKTAIISVSPVINLTSLITTSGNNVLVNPTVEVAPGKVKNEIIIPVSSIFEIQFKLNKNVSVKSIQAVVRNKKVLGLNSLEDSESNQASSNYVNLVETSPGVYTGKLKSFPNPGLYEIYIRIVDYNGNISEQKLADLIITQKLTVFEKGNKNPIENARILLYLYNEKTKVYEVIAPDILSIQNPSYSLPDGTFNLILPVGKYKAEVSAIGYNSSEIEFAVTSSINSYPQIYLQKLPFSIINSIDYYTNIFFDTLTVNQDYLREQATSNRLFNFLTSIALLCFVFIVFLSFSAKTHISPLSIPYYFIYKLKLMFEKTKSSVIIGKITEKTTQNPVSKANVYLIDAIANRIIAHSKTDKLGDFYFDKPKVANFKISVMKKGYLSAPFMEFETKYANYMPLNLGIEKDEKHIKNIFDIAFVYVEDLFGVILEFLIVMSFVFEVFFILTFGFIRIAPYLILTSFNFILLFIFIYKPRKLSGPISLSYS